MACMANEPVQMYSDHRVVDGVVLPGASHVALIATTFTSRSSRVAGRASRECDLQAVMFLRPFVVRATKAVSEEPTIVYACGEVVSAVGRQHLGRKWLARSDAAGMPPARGLKARVQRGVRCLTQCGPEQGATAPAVFELSSL